MNLDQTRIQELISRLAESLNIEVKRWINPTDPSGIAKIAQAALALRNRNGGYIVIGFDNKTLQPDTGNEPQDVRAAFHIDKIQGIISRYSSDLFEVAIRLRQAGWAGIPRYRYSGGNKNPSGCKARSSRRFKATNTPW